MDSLVHEGYTIRYPRADSVENAPSSWLVLHYLEFDVRMFPAYATDDDDALAGKLGYRNRFDFELAVENTRPTDIDSASDLETLKRATLLLAEKKGGFSPSAYSAVFDDGVRRGFIRALKPDGKSVDAVIYFPATRTCDEMYFIGKGAVDVLAVQRFLSVLRIEPAPAASLPAAGTER